jgi:predicted RNA-binding Zn-ribbon protein involved in translation (DUF1610 family)
MEWTDHEIRKELIRRSHTEAAGICPDSGETIDECWNSELCDCSFSQPYKCDICGMIVWTMRDHNRLHHKVKS